MMKYAALLVALAIAALCQPPHLRAEAPPLFAPEPPEPGASALVTAYLPLLAAGQFDQALTLNDQRGMRQYLLERRMAELKVKNAELTAKDLETMSVQIQLNDLNPARLREILLRVMQEAGYEGMTWTIRGYAPAPEPIGGYLVSVDARTAAGQEKPILLGIKKLGEHWMVAPEVIEKLMGKQPVVRVTPSAPPPAEVAGQVDAFWKLWQAGELNEAYTLFSTEYRGRISILNFLQQAQEVIARIGVPTAWAIVNSREIAPAVLGLGVNVQGSTGTTPTIMLFRKTGETWVLEDSQFRPPSAGPVPAPAQTNLSAPVAFRSNFQPDLKPTLGPAAPAVQPTPANPPPAPVKPDVPSAATPQ